MKTYKNLFKKVVSDEIIDSAFINACYRKNDRPEIIAIKEHYDLCKSKLKEFLIKGKYKPIKHLAREINDGFKLKKRNVIVPKFTARCPEQWIQHIVVLVLEPIFRHGMYEFSCGSVPGRGVHYGKKYIEKYIREHKKEIRYVLKLDIRHFYETINVDLLKERLKRIIKDDKMLELIFFILDSNFGIKENGEIIRSGLPIGFYTSQWFANWFLQPFDHFVKEDLKASFYMRYMDDIVIFGSNKRDLHKIFIEIKKYLSGLDLEVKSNWQVFKFDYIDKNGKRQGRFVDFMGFKFYRDKTTIRKSIFLRACRLARRLEKKLKISWYDSCRLLSYLGWFVATDTYEAFKKHIEPRVNINSCKKIVSKHSKKGDSKNGNYLQGNTEQQKTA